MKDYYAIIPAKIRYDKELPPNAKLIYGELYVLCQKEGFCWASNGYFSRLYNVEKRTVSHWINLLKKKGYIFFESMEENIYGIEKNNNNYRKIFLAPMEKNIYPNNKKNNKKSNIGKNDMVTYDMELIEYLIDNK